MSHNKRRIIRLGSLFLIVGLFLALLTGCIQQGPKVDREDVKLASEQVQIAFRGDDSATNVTQDFDIPTEINEYQVSWISSNKELVAISGGVGLVNLPPARATVYLTAKVGTNGVFEYKTFTLVLKGDGQLPGETELLKVRF